MARARSDLAAAELERVRARSALEAAMGVTGLGAYSVERPGPARTPEAGDLEEAVRKALARRPERAAL